MNVNEPNIDIELSILVEVYYQVLQEIDVNGLRRPECYECVFAWLIDELFVVLSNQICDTIQTITLIKWLGYESWRQLAFLYGC